MSELEGRDEALRKIDQLLVMAKRMEKRIGDLTKVDGVLTQLERKMQQREDQQRDIERKLSEAEGGLEKLERLVTEFERRSSGPECRRQELLGKATEIFNAVEEEEKLCDGLTDNEPIPLEDVLRTLSFLYGRLAVLEKQQPV